MQGLLEKNAKESEKNFARTLIKIAKILDIFTHFM